MTEAQRCPRCRCAMPDDAPQGLCPACLIAAVMDASEATQDHAHESGNGSDPEETTDSSGSRADEAAPSIIRYFGDYQVYEELGRGGMGVVYRARQLSLNRFVALKMIRAGALAGVDELRRFQNEVEAVALLDHPGIVPVYEVGEHDSQRYFSMKLVEGGNLADRLEVYRDDPRAAAAMLAEAAEAVHHAHVRGILHRDLKPANVLVDESGRPHITDFGLAKRVEADAEMTATGAILGTPAYMAPEQALGRRGAITTATDVHGLGTVFYALLTGLPPFSGDSLVDTLTKVKEQPPEPPRKVNARVPRDLELICLKCLEKDPRRRYPSAQALADDARAWLGGKPVKVRPVGALERAALFVRRRPALAAAYALTAAVIVLAGFGGSIAWLWRTAEGARAEAVAARDGETRARSVAEKALVGEARARSVAEKALVGEAQARSAAEKARDGEARARAEAERQREKSERSDYGRTIHMAQQKLEENNVAGALALLESTRPDFRGWEWRHLHYLCHADLMTLAGHIDGVLSPLLIGGVLSASFSADGSRILTSGADGTAKVWDAVTGAETRALKGHRSHVNTASFSPDGARIVTASLDGTAKVWDAMNGSLLVSFGGDGYTGSMFAASFSPDGARIVTASRENSGTVWDAKVGAELLHLLGHTGPIGRMSFSPDGTQIVTPGLDGTAKLWDAKTGRLVRSFDGHAGLVFSASFSADGSRIVTASEDETARVWDAESAKEIHSLKGHTGTVMSASFSPDGRRIVTAGDDKTAKVWDTKTGSLILSLKGHTSRVNTASFSPDGRRIVTASGDGTAKVWDANRGSDLPISKWHGPATMTASFSQDGLRIVTTGWDDETTKVWDAKSASELLSLSAPGPASQIALRTTPNPTTSARFSPDGTQIVTPGRDGTAKLWDAKSGVLVRSFEGHAGVVHTASFSPDGLRIVTAGDDKTAKVWDARTGARLLSFTGHGNVVRSARFSPDGLRIVTAGDDKTAIVWDAQSGAEVVLLEGHTAVVYSASFSPDGSRVVTASADETARVWDARSGAELFSFKGHTLVVFAASFSPDGSRVVTASWDKTAKVWDAVSGVEVISLKGHTGPVTSASFSLDGSRIVTAGAADRDVAMIVWDAGPDLPAVRRPPMTVERPIKPSPQPRSVDGFLSDLHRAGKGQLADELGREIEQASNEVEQVERYDARRGGHVIVGRVVGDGLTDASRVIAQMKIHREGHFVGSVGGSNRPVGFRKQGYLPVEITPTGGPGSVEYVGDIRLEPVPEAMRAAVKGRIVLKGPATASWATMTLRTDPGPFNSPVYPFDPFAPGDSVEVTTGTSGEIFASGLSPMEYTMDFSATGSIGRDRSVTLKPGETIDLGTIRLGRRRPIVVSYRVAPRPPFDESPTFRQVVLWSGKFHATSPEGEDDLRFDQRNDSIRFGNPYCKVADLGRGKLEDYLRADPPPTRFTWPGNLNPQTDHVYLIDHKPLNHYVLFQFAPAATEE